MSEPTPSPTPPAAASRTFLVVAGLVLAVAGFVAGVLVARPVTKAVEAGRLAAGARAPDGSPVLAQVDGQILSADQFRVRWNELIAPKTRRFHEREGGPSHYLEEVVEEMLLAEEASRRGLAERPDVREAIRRDVNLALGRALLEEEVSRKAIPEKELRARFEARRDEWARPTRVRVREIVATSSHGPVGMGFEDDAVSREAARAKVERLRARAEAGEDFAELASRYSESPTGRHDGLVGWVVPGRFVQQYEEAALALAPGELSAVLETEDGFVVLRAEAREEGGTVSFEEKRDEVRRELLAEDPGALNRRYRLFVDEITKDHRVLVNPELLPDSLDGGAEP